MERKRFVIVPFKRDNGYQVVSGVVTEHQTADPDIWEGGWEMTDSHPLTSDKLTISQAEQLSIGMRLAINQFQAMRQKYPDLE